MKDSQDHDTAIDKLNDEIFTTKISINQLHAKFYMVWKQNIFEYFK
jgi:hypothetical protein